MHTKDRNPGRIAFAMTRYNLLRLAFNAIIAVIRGENGIVITFGDFEVAKPPSTSKKEVAS